MFYQAFSRKMCIRGKTISVWMSNFTLLRTLQYEKYAPTGERFFLNVCSVKYQFFLHGNNRNKLRYDRLGAAFIHVLG